MAETPRTWTLTRRFGESWLVTGPDGDRGPIEVVEKAPMDAERERMLDILAELFTNRATIEAHRPGIYDYRSARTAETLLREHGQLK